MMPIQIFFHSILLPRNVTLITTLEPPSPTTSSLFESTTESLIPTVTPNRSS